MSIRNPPRDFNNSYRVFPNPNFRKASSPSEVFGRIPFADTTILGIPWVLFFLLALSLGLMVAGLWNIVSWCWWAAQAKKKKTSDPGVSPSVECSPQSPKLDQSLPPSCPPPPYQTINGEFRGSRSMPPTYVPTPFITQPTLCYYY